MKAFKSTILAIGAMIGLSFVTGYAQEAFRPQQAVEIHYGRLLIGAGATGFLQFEGATVDDYQTTVRVTDPTADRTITFPNAAGTVMLSDAASSSKVVGGVTTLDGSNPTNVTTGLSDIAWCHVDFTTATALADDPSQLTIDMHTGGTLAIYALKFTNGTDPTLIASTDSTMQINWSCGGTP